MINIKGYKSQIIDLKKNNKIQISNVNTVNLELGAIDIDTSFEGGEKKCEQKAEIVSVKPKIIELNEESSDIFILMNMCILTNQVNLNNLEFTEDYIDGIVNNKDVYIGIPLQVNRVKLENGFYKTLTHELDKKTGQLKTDSIGAFVDFWKETDDDGVIKLMGSVKIYKRYPHVCSAIIDLYESGDLEFSCEMYAYGYAEINEETGVRKVNYEYDGTPNSLFGSCVVTYGAEVRSKANLLIAEAVNKDFEGGEEMADTEPKVEVFNKGIEVRYHGGIETSALKFDDISKQIYNLLNPVNPRTEYREYNYYIRDIYTDYVIVEDWNSYSRLYKIGYSIVNDIVQLDSEEKWVSGRLDFVPDGVTVDDLLAQVQQITTELNELKNKHKEELQEMSETNAKTLEELQVEVSELTTKVTELNSTIVSQQEKITELEGKEVELNAKIAELEPYKTQVEVAEKQAKQEALKEKYAKLLSEETRKSEDYVKAIEELSEAKLNELVVAEVSAKTKEENRDKQENNDVIVNARKEENLIPQDRREKLYAPRD